jgi:hypothetical protein
MAGIRIEGRDRNEVEAVAVQLGVSITRVYGKQRGEGVMGYGRVEVDGSRRVQITEEQIMVIANLFKDRMELEHAKRVFEESQIIDAEFTVG